MLQLHLPTLLAAVLAGYLLLTLELGLAQDGVRARPELRRWTWANWAMLAGWAALLVRPWVPASLSFVLGNGLLGLGLVLYHQAFQLLLGDRQPSRRGFWFIGLWRLALVGMLPWPPALRTASVSVVCAALLLPSALRLARACRPGLRSMRTVLVTLVLAIAALGTRAVHALLDPSQYATLWPASPGQGLTLFVASVALLGGGFGFVLATFERVAQDLETMASHDGLTGCLNRSTTDALLGHALARAQREGSPLAFVLLDLDHFKRVNDEHGHRAGDEALRRFAAAARERLRHADIIGRTGGEEFGLVLPATDAAGARRLVDDVRRATMALSVEGLDGQPVRLTVSAGIAVASAEDWVSADRLYSRADQALYEAKRAGRNRVVCYGDSNPRQGVLIA